MDHGWLRSHLITETLCFGADGTIVWGHHNCPGSWNDGETSQKFMQNSRCTVILPDQTMGVLSDSAFAVPADMFGRIETPLKEKYLARIPSHLQAAMVQKSNAICSIRQAPEWEMGAAEKPFQPLPFNPFLRGMRLNYIHMLSNLRVLTTGISQIRTEPSFMNKKIYHSVRNFITHPLLFPEIAANIANIICCCCICISERRSSRRSSISHNRSSLSSRRPLAVRSFADRC